MNELDVPLGGPDDIADSYLIDFFREIVSP